MTERLQLARALAEKHGRRAVVMKDWRPLLAFSDGNPLALTVLVGQALREELASHDAVAAFVEKLRTGEAKFDDVESEGRSRSLGASLGYGFEHAFNEGERRQLALLHLFQGFVDVDALKTMGHPEMPWCLPEVRGLSRDDGIALLDRAAEVGLLTRHGGGYYGIHPALPWFFRGLFERHYGESKEAATRAFVEAMGGLGNYYFAQYDDGNRDVISALRAEEANLLQARRLARVHGWWHRVTSAMQGLRQLYHHTGRRAEWKRLVEEIVHDFVDPETEGPLAGREDDWGLVTEYRARLAQEERNWAEAERLQQVDVEWERRRAAPLLARARESLDSNERNTVRSLAASLHELGEIRRELGREACVASYKESLELSESIGERAGAAACAFNLGHAYKDLSALRDLDQAVYWYRRSLELRDERDRLGRGRCLAQLGNVVYERFKDARARKAGTDELLRHLNEAAGFYHQALELTPPDAVHELAVAHNALGAIYGDAGDLDRALPHYRDSIRYEEAQGNLYGASQTRFNVAVDLAGAGRLQDALAYAEAALRGFESYGESAAEMIQRTRGLIEWIRRKNPP
jgi:TPR repeat protein